MRIGVCLYPTVGGSGYLGTRLGQHLADRGHEVHFITYEEPFALMWEDAPGVHVDLVDRFDYPLFESIGPPYAMALTSKIVKVARGSNLDLIHCHYAIPHAMAAYMAREIVDIPYAVTLHGSDVHTLGQDPAYRPVVHHTVETADRVSSVSNFLRRAAHDDLFIDRDIEVIPNFIDTNRFAPTKGLKLVVESGCVSVRREEDAEEIQPDELVLLHASNFREVKRVPQLVDIMREVVDEHPNTRLILVGDGPARIEVERKIEKLDLCHNVHLLGIKSNMSQIMASADVFLQNSTMEGMPLVLLEAMSSGVPVVTTPAGGIPELVRKGKDGIVTEGFELDEYAEAVIKVISDKDLREKMGIAARKRVEKKFSAEEIVPVYEKMLQSVVEE
ncbi:MAG: N-acetyl-alpha-D-glucosaminyl L-malate synthase BshA [Candidatus Thorarchaeota archaeon]|nr:N-acetyl-alpha-D-glucosaminyl L-malate synthase BshA [Candidatus Thorarchaeota archaeon]